MVFVYRVTFHYTTFYSYNDVTRSKSWARPTNFDPVLFYRVNNCRDTGPRSRSADRDYLSLRITFEATSEVRTYDLPVTKWNHWATATDHSVSKQYYTARLSNCNLTWNINSSGVTTLLKELGMNWTQGVGFLFFFYYLYLE